MTTIAAIQRQEDSRGILEILSGVITRYRFRSFFISGLPDSDMDITDAVLLTGGNTAWYQRYVEMGFVRHDAVARHCLVTTLPFDWDVAPYDPVTEPEMHRVREEARSFGLDAGLCIPMHMEGALEGAVSLVGDPKGLDSQQLLEIHMLALYTYGQLRFLRRKEDPQIKPGTITGREAEVLKWVATGKTAAEIAEITGLSPRTINQHCENAQKRLGTSNRVHTVVEALRHKLIAL